MRSTLRRPFVRRAAVVPAGVGLALWSIAAAAAALSTKLPPPSTTVFECAVNGIPMFTDQPCIAEERVEIVKVAPTATEHPLTAQADAVQSEDSGLSRYALMFAGFAGMAYFLRRRNGN